MKPKNDIHKYKRKFETAKKNMLEPENRSNKAKALYKRLGFKEILPENKELIKEMTSTLKARGWSYATLDMWLSLTRALDNRLRVPIKQINDKKTLEPFVTWMRDHYSPSGRERRCRLLKTFFQVLHDCERGEYPPFVSWIDGSIKDSEKREKKVIPEELVKRIWNSCVDARSQCLLAILDDLGARIGEIGRLKRSSIKESDEGVDITLIGKTGERTIESIVHAKYILKWCFDLHPAKNDAEARLFPIMANNYEGNYHKVMSYNAFRKILHNIFDRAGLTEKEKKLCHFHAWRHRRATLLAPHVTRAVLCYFMGWTKNSEQPGRYIHMDSEKARNPIRRMYNINTGGNGEEKLDKRIRCNSCGEWWPPDKKYCNSCGTRLVSDDMDKFQMMKMLRQMQKQINELKTKN